MREEVAPHRYDYPGSMKASFGKVIFDSEIED
jgi:hypothetical protein